MPWCNCVYCKFISENFLAAVDQDEKIYEAYSNDRRQVDFLTVKIANKQFPAAENTMFSIFAVQRFKDGANLPGTLCNSFKLITEA